MDLSIKPLGVNTNIKEDPAQADKIINLANHKQFLGHKISEIKVDKYDLDNNVNDSIFLRRTMYVYER